MLTRRLVEKVLGMLTLILWGPFAYIAIPEAVDKLPSHQVPLFIIAICLPLFIPLLLLLSEGFWAKHIGLTTVLGWLWGLLAALRGFVLLFLLPLMAMGMCLSGYSNSVIHAVLVWLIAGIVLLWTDAVVILTRVRRPPPDPDAAVIFFRFWRKRR